MITRVSIVVFGVLYVVAAVLYPGGTRTDHTTIGFSLRDNYWCDLLDQTSYRGVPNMGASVALAAMLTLCVGLSVLWWRAPLLFPASPKRAGVVRVAGVASGIVIPLVATRYHDIAINLAGLLALVAFVTTLTMLRRRSFFLSAGTLAFALTDYLIWQTRLGLEALASIQKVAFVFFLAWAYRLAGSHHGDG